ncbi:uncharacterized protein LOC126661332 [Mercurialis annua]|uniref:uncharacterized protein LOC126661332 n=1 Tax=Mercurialis annua TaxID=3986 RepID=UPI00215E7C84|nr:uncharacterized protein LOC126661332 [Mercurialis annua]
MILSCCLLVGSEFVLPPTPPRAAMAVSTSAPTQADGSDGVQTSSPMNATSSNHFIEMYDNDRDGVYLSIPGEFSETWVLLLHIIFKFLKLVLLLACRFWLGLYISGFFKSSS